MTTTFNVIIVVVVSVVVVKSSGSSSNGCRGGSSSSSRSSIVFILIFDLFIPFTQLPIIATFNRPVLVSYSAFPHPLIRSHRIVREMKIPHFIIDQPPPWS